MYIKYQHVRNSVVITAAIAVGLWFLFARGREDTTALQTPDLSARTDRVAAGSVTSSSGDSGELPKSDSLSAIKAEIDASDAPRKTSLVPVSSSTPRTDIANNGPGEGKTADRETLYRKAMTVASQIAPSNGKGKDVLGAGSPWKLNLYDDNTDGQWDRAKLDYDRDETEDENWTFKKGRWEKDGGRTIWDGQSWITYSPTTSQPAKSQQPDSDSVDPILARYRSAMKIAMGRAASSGKGKDVLGPASPWKLNLYDDDKDGRWDRGKLDYDRDEIDNEKWNFKNGRWEKDDGKTIWNGNDWIPK